MGSGAGLTETVLYDTLVNYQSGARLLEQSLTMQARAKYRVRR